MSGEDHPRAFVLDECQEWVINIETWGSALYQGPAPILFFLFLLNSWFIWVQSNIMFIPSHFWSSHCTSLFLSCFCSHFSLMFWTNWNEQAPSIMRASLNGANVLAIIGSDIKTPNGLAIDHRAEKLYFSDATLDKIERCEYDGSSRYVRQPFIFFRCANRRGWLAFQCSVKWCLHLSASGFVEEWACSSIWLGCVWRLHLLDWLGEEGRPQSWQIHRRRHETAACWHPSAADGDRCCG